MKRACFLAIFLPLLLACSENGKSAVNGLVVERKYALKDCLVRMDFTWAGEASPSAKEGVIQEIIAAMREATVVTHTLPMFLGHTTGDRSYFVLYFTDKCENRKALTERFVNEFVKPRSKAFPMYSVVSEGFEPGFDGVLPSGAWIEDQ